MSKLFRLVAIVHETFHELVISVVKMTLQKRDDLNVGVVEKDLNVSFVRVLNFIPVLEDCESSAKVRFKVNETVELSASGISLNFFQTCVVFLKKNANHLPLEKSKSTSNLFRKVLINRAEKTARDLVKRTLAVVNLKRRQRSIEAFIARQNLIINDSEQQVFRPATDGVVETQNRNERNQESER